MKHKRWALAWAMMVLLLLGLTGSQALGEAEAPSVHGNSAEPSWVDQVRQIDWAAAQAWVEEEWAQVVQFLTETKSAQEVRALVEEIQQSPWWADVEAWCAHAANLDYQQVLTQWWQNASSAGEQLLQELGRWLESAESQLR